LTVVSDTSPLNYLILLGEAELLPRLYGRIVIPDVVRDELRHAGAPPAVAQWVRQLPPWVELIEGTARQQAGLDAGEAAAIRLARRIGVDLLLLDDQTARVRARRLGIKVTGVLGVLAAAALRGHIDIEAVVHRLHAETNFRASPSLLEKTIDFVREHRSLRGDSPGSIDR
jgi:predicted nucleic acid-binding protein